MTRLLDSKNTIVYGGGGSIGGGVARTFAREGARVFLAGRTRGPLEAVAADIEAAGGSADVAVLDVLDGAAVDDHAAAVAAEAGSIDATFLAVKRGDVQGTPLIDMTDDQLTRAPTTGLLATHHMARAAARQMTTQGSGAILTLTSATSVAPSPGMGSTGPTDAAIEAYLQTLAHEVGPQGVRVACLWTAAVAETLTTEKLAEVSGVEMDPEEVLKGIAGMALLRRAPRLQQFSDTYRMMGSFEEAEDLVQEALLRAWRSRESFEGGPLFRAWLYRIATNVCLDALRRRSRRPTTVSSFGEVPWLQPYPDRLLDELPSEEDEPDAVVVTKETIELAFLAVIQALPPLQRAVLILRDALGWSARESAEILETSVAA
jgi:RNA polymerase sigma factor (sigma-70 family)